MRIVKNEQLIKRNSRIGQFTSLGGMIALVGGMFVSIRYPQQISIALGALLAGFILTQVSLYLGNRFGRSPRPDESLDASLKGLPGDFTIYHYTTPASHLLVGPAGVWVLLPYRQAGKISFQNNRWRLKGGGFVQNYMRLFGQEGLGRPDADAQAEVRAVEKEFARAMDGGQAPEVQAALEDGRTDGAPDGAEDAGVAAAPSRCLYTAASCTVPPLRRRDARRNRSRRAPPTARARRDR